MQNDAEAYRPGGIDRRSFLKSAAAFAAGFSVADWTKRPTKASARLEQGIRHRLGIPPSAEYVLIVDQAAHLDWDWWYTFDQYFALPRVGPPPSPLGYGVDAILTEAVKVLRGNHSPQPKESYYYSLSEMGFFQEFVNTKLEQGVDIVSQIRNFGEHLRIVGGGIVSPDCLLSSGESFLRNYLLGKLWLASLFPELLPLKHCWVPDDFGQDPDLPIAAKALGMSSISFSRLPGIAPGNWQQTELQTDVIAHGADFWWIASDNASTLFTHFMVGGTYSHGANLATSNGVPAKVVSAIQTFLRHNDNAKTLKPPFSAAPSNYIYMPVDDDFMYPIANLLDYVNTWNLSGQTEGVYAVEASYDDFVSLVLASGTNLETRAYNGTPYWTGHYATRPGLKILHYGTSRLLLAAEVFGLLAFGLGASAQTARSYWSGVSGAWNDLVPSTHHDYICGTSTDSVTKNEQIPLLQTAFQAAAAAVETALSALGASAGNPGEVLIANPAGIPFWGPVELPGLLPPGMTSMGIEQYLTPVQAAHGGGCVFTAGVPSMGYTIGKLSQQIVQGPLPATISPESPEATAYTLKNEFLTLVVSAASHWGISSIQNANGEAHLSGATSGNDLVFYTDPGNTYQFANEISGYTSFAPANVTVRSSGPGLGPTILESGPVRVRLQTVATVTHTSGLGGWTQTYTREYALVAGESFVRMTTTGAAPSGFSVMTAFPLTHPITSIVHGTANHWTAVQPHPISKWTPPVFQATHHFLLPEANGKVLAAIYHPEVPAWGYDKSGVLLGCLFRNTPGTQRGNGLRATDPDTHTVRYGFRVRDNDLQAPETGEPLVEALNYVAPAMARLISGAPKAARRPAFSSIASISAPGIIQAAKPGDVVPGTLILRIYNPSNTPKTLAVALGAGRPAAVQAVTALEDPITTDAPPIQITRNGFIIHVTTALNTVQISFNP